ncbi:MAG TPA: hypothetical protein VLD37_03300 [Candidatus Bilamarchaeum sp.]|nr:hypothetical protein [Candidatus Bilamarchaeum sp.]
MADLRRQYFEKERKEYPYRRIDFYKVHANWGLVDSIQRVIAARQMPEMGDLKSYLLTGNERAAKIVAEYTAQFGKLTAPRPGGYMIVEKECVDARAATAVIFDMLDLPRIHERTAGAVVRKGPAFFALHPSLGRGYVKTHFACGGEDVAHKHYITPPRERGQVDEHVQSIVDSIPYATASITDPVLRCKQNARIQAENASGLLNSGKNGTRPKMGNEVHPVMVTWEAWGKGENGKTIAGADAVDVLWCSRTQADEDQLVTQMRQNFKTLWAIAADLGRSPVKNGSQAAQYSHTIVFYDPFRLGVVNNPRAIFDQLPNEMFCVTEDFRDRKLNNGSLSSTALGSLRYAGFLGGGHVCGVGGNGGSRHILILDPDPATMLKVKEKLLASSQDIRDLTRNGETITLAKYDIDTARVEFI